MIIIINLRILAAQPWPLSNKKSPQFNQLEYYEIWTNFHLYVTTIFCDNLVWKWFSSGVRRCKVDKLDFGFPNHKSQGEQKWPQVNSRKWNISATDGRKWNPSFALEAFLESIAIYTRKKPGLQYVFPVFECFTNRNRVYIQNLRTSILNEQ